MSKVLQDTATEKHSGIPAENVEQTHSSAAKEFVNAFLYSAAESPWKGIKQLVGGENLPELNIAQAPQLASTGTGKWFAQEIGGALGAMVPFVITATALKKVGFAAEVEATAATRIPLGLSLKQSAIAGFVDDFVTRPSDQQGSKFWTDRALNGAGGAINILALAGSARAAAKLLPFGDTATASFGSKVLQNTLYGAMAGVPAGLASSEFSALRSGQLLPTAATTEQSLLSMVVVGGVLGGGQVVAERTGANISAKTQSLADDWHMYRQPALRPALIALTSEPMGVVQKVTPQTNPMEILKRAARTNPINANPTIGHLDSAIAKQRGYLYEPVAGHDSTTSATALTQSNRLASNFEIADPLADGFQALNSMANSRLWRVVTGKPFPMDKVVTVVVDRTMDPTLNNVIEQARARFKQPGANPDRMPQELAAFVKGKMFSRSFQDSQEQIKDLVDKEVVNAQDLMDWNQRQEARHAKQLEPLAGKKVLLGSFIDLAQRNEGFGVCIEQAMLYKVLADELGMQGTNLVIGAGGRGKMSIENPGWTPRHAWAEVPQDGRMVPVDVINGRFGDENKGLLKPGRDVMIEARPKILANWLSPMLSSWSEAQAKAKSLVQSIAKANKYVRLPDAVPASVFMGDVPMFGTAH